MSYVKFTGSIRAGSSIAGQRAFNDKPADPMPSDQFKAYERNLKKLWLADLLEHQRQKTVRWRLSIAGPCYTEEQWLALKAASTAKSKTEPPA